MSKSDIVVDCK